MRPNKANKAKLSSVLECLHSGVVWGGQTRLPRLNSWVGILGGHIGAFSGWVSHKAKLVWQTCRENLYSNDPKQNLSCRQPRSPIYSCMHELWVRLGESLVRTSSVKMCQYPIPTGPHTHQSNKCTVLEYWYGRVHIAVLQPNSWGTAVLLLATAVVFQHMADTQ